MKITTILIVLFFVVFWSGWAMNVFKLVNSDFEAPYKTEIIRSVSLIPPVGAITGWMDIGEENAK